MKNLFGGLEGGGTKFICAVGTSPEEVLEEIRIPTTSPEQTLEQVVAFFRKFNLTAIGLAPFGPLNLDTASPEYGSIAATPKLGWSGVNIVGPFRKAFDLPLAFDLDVNAAAYGEYIWVAQNQGVRSLVYYTIGTGIGAGVIIDGKIVHGLTHPEAGHLRLPHDRKKDPFPGICPFHGDCFEGLASGPALERRWGKPSTALPYQHPAWELEATYIAHALVDTIFLLSPERIVLGGGVMGQQSLLPSIRTKVQQLLNNYISSPLLAGSLQEYLVPPSLGNRSGVLGALALAKLAGQR